MRFPIRLFGQNCLLNCNDTQTQITDIVTIKPTIYTIRIRKEVFKNFVIRLPNSSKICYIQTDRELDGLKLLKSEHQSLTYIHFS